VDLDGTLILSDLLWESLVRLLKTKPWWAPAIPFWWSGGRARLKAALAARVEVDPATLPYNQPFLDFLRAEKERGRTLLLVTASDAALAKQVADHTGLFAEVLASDGRTNLRGRNKGARLAERFGKGGFDYAGNSTVDLPVWEQARQALVVNARAGLAERAAKVSRLGPAFTPRAAIAPALFQVLRPHHWIKNLIIFVPLVTSHKLTQLPLALEGLAAFLAFSLCASGVYVLNDLLDVDADRHHPRKRARPFASGELPLSVGLAIFPLLFVASLLVGLTLPAGFLAVLGIYVLLTTGYSWLWKQIALLDVFCLASLYTIRLIAGHEATRVVYSSWLLVFSMFIFLSLALVKRFVELKDARQGRASEIKGRGYAREDVELVSMLGSSCGYMAVLVLALYVNSPEVRLLYQRPTLLLLICPVLLYWISRVWLVAHRGQMHDDPIVFALKDRVSYLAAALALFFVWLATGH
jgi:4-hydroxybenzoate polyprenyltransferase